MKFFHSVRWRLQLWHGLLLVLALAGFGFTAWELQRANQLGRVDRELEERMGIVEGAMKPDKPPADDRSPQPGKIRLSPREQNLFDGMPGQVFYYAIWLRDGQQTGASASAPADIPRPGQMPGPPVFRSRAALRECFHDTPSGECVLVGRDISDEIAGIRRIAWLLAVAGGAVLGLGLAGGWWVAARALRPISEISATAKKISAGDLGQRIRPTDSESELGCLATDLNHTFAELQGAFERQARFTADASHELRTPVAVVLAQTQSALTRERPAGEYREYLEACQRAAGRMRGIIEDLLALARLDSAGSKPVAEPCDLDRIVRETVELLGPVAAECDIRLDLSPARCIGDSGQLARAVSNLISNAIQYNRPGGSVRITLDGGTDDVTLSVSDTGQGIPPDDLPHVFERFFRADKSRSSAKGHAGLGLAITKAIVDSHRGTIDVVSEPGRGSTFTVKLPARPKA
ncbi:MAG: HAMP domain-containing protein [Verrucomicrobiaceae bacterium]|nr:MAG: HAMP domain-containing protein [Verrucomicrobiaceae bacterium]